MAPGTGRLSPTIRPWLAASAACGLLLPAAVGAQGLIPLECRLGTGAWQPCRMQVMEVGSHWVLLVAGQRIEFRHDGRGGVSMQAGGGGWRSVSSHWEHAENLCWDGVCARGAIPLD